MNDHNLPTIVDDMTTSVVENQTGNAANLKSPINDPLSSSFPAFQLVSESITEPHFLDIITAVLPVARSSYSFD